MVNYLYIFYPRQINIFLLYYSYKERKERGTKKMMNEIVRNDINYMIRHARKCAKKLSNDNDYMRKVIERDFNLADGGISALLRAEVIDMAEWRYDRMVLKHHYCRLMAVYGDRSFMYKDDMEFYKVYVR